MKKIKIILFISLAILFLQACCTKEYTIGDIQRNFSFIDISTDKDVFFGNDKTWNKDSILIKYNSSGTYNKIFNSLYSKYQDSTIVINFNNNDSCFIKFPNNDIDTFLIKYEEQTRKSFGGPCKMKFNVIKSLAYNNVYVDINHQPIKIFKSF